MYIMRFFVIMSLLTLDTFVISKGSIESSNCNNSDENCCYGNWNSEETKCECWSLQIFGSKCNYVCRDDLCNGVGICDENSYPVYVNGSFHGKCVCDNPGLSSNNMCYVEENINSEQSDNSEGEDNSKNVNSVNSEYSDSGSGYSNMELNEVDTNVDGISIKNSSIYLYVLIGLLFLVVLFLIYFNCKRRKSERVEIEKKNSKVSISVQTVDSEYSDSEEEYKTYRNRSRNSFVDLRKESEEGEDISERVSTSR
jgi:hypothetical protein